ncbi:up-regulator of cell proliferation-like isoform X2 [Heteronotia binoei]|uniref:up-regulator of cell proliferation-like isoform X2 n=1 Tax=Heteronotia binoei TaxID=13085 RepID=UPI00292FF4E2|nr:up-regulator of cell proliferation-like isoform X2 [Heteronotia binoei]
MAFETIRRGREKLLTFLQRAPELILDDTAAQGFISEADYEALDKLPNPKEKMRKLLVKVQIKGEQTCHRFLEGIRSLFPDLPPDLWPPGSDLKQGDGSPDKVLVNSGPENSEAEAVKVKEELSTKDSKDKELENVSGIQEPDQEAMETESFDEGVKSFLMKLGLHKRCMKLTMGEILEINSESLTPVAPQTLEDLPQHFLRKLMALSGTARNTDLGHQDEEESNEEVDMDDEGFFLRGMNSEVSVNPLDVLCAVLFCSDSFLQQEIFLKMSMCQFALPLILPPPKCTFMLWALRDIVRKWRPHCLVEQRGFREDSLVQTSMPTISFVRIGRSSLSKSRLLNEVLSSPQQHHDFFIHRDMECGSAPREISDGLVEIAWYFPAGRENSDLFPEPVAITNLRGDIESHWPQFSFLTEVSSAVFILTENMSDKQYDMLATLQGSTSKYYFILNVDGEKSKETLKFLNKLAPLLSMTKSQILLKERNKNTTEFVKKFRSTIRNIVNSPQKVISIQEMAKVSQELGIQTDEDTKACQNGTLHGNEIIEEIEDVVAYKKEMLKLQGDLWRNLAKVEKELCRMKRQADMPAEDYKAQLRKKLIALRSQQNQCDLTNGITKFINGIQQLHPVEKSYFLKWLKFNLDCTARKNLSNLREQYKELYHTAGNDPRQLAQLDELISTSSLGVEHFMRELGQFYEAEYMMVKEGKITEECRQFVLLPDIAADLMLEGFPMELIDGDASNIPLQWIIDVLTALHSKLGGKSRMKVLTVLGVQSTGKSTLLNTMFGLQFAVSSGRCTRGAFMTLLRVSEDFQKELSCNFILVIDTEGLKAPELAKLEDSYEHDNELATLVIGLSDITLVNLAMENATEMKDILQIVVHAFLRMEETGHKPNCQFVHQNVSDVSAHDQNMRDRKRLLEQLNDMTRAAARMEKQFREVSFSDIMDYNPEKHNWYIPGLWHGVPPMAPVNMGYSEGVSDLKRSLFEYMKTCSQNRRSKDIPQFVEWVRSLWNAVKHENFIFSFRNSLVADAYNQLSAKYSEWEWDFQKEMHLWVSKADTTIQNQSLEDIESGALDKLRLEADQKLCDGQQKMLQCIQNYFESDRDSLHLIEKYREDFIRSAKGLREQLESYCIKKCQQAFLIRKGQSKIDSLQAKYVKTMEGKVNKLLEECKRKKSKLNSFELNKEFKKMWKETLLELPPSNLTRREIYTDFHFQLQKDLEVRGGFANQLFQRLPCFSARPRRPFTMQDCYLEKSFMRTLKGLLYKDYIQELDEYTRSLICKCESYVTEKVSTKGDYDETYCRELLRMINEQLQGKDFRNLHTTIHFEVDLKYFILGKAANAFQKMHTKFFEANNPHRCLEKLKPQYLSTFKDLYYEKDACQKRAKDFCDLCLKPALVDHLHKRLGIEIVDDLLSSGQSLQYGSRSFFQFTVQKTLLEEQNFEDYVEYINRYEKFVKSWIQAHLLDHYKEREELAILERGILSTVMKKAKEVLERHENETEPLAEFLEHFCQKLSEELVISKDSLDVILFNNTANAKSFSAEVQACIPTVIEDILSENFKMSVEAILLNLPFKPQDEIFKRVFGCGKQCPFCKVPCEAGGGGHQEHFASVHRPEGLGRYRDYTTNILVYSLCSSSVSSNGNFRNSDTAGKWHPYKQYRQHYPDWRIQPDASITASDYWKFVFKEFNQQFAKEYDALPADLPEDWERLTKQQALESIQETFNMK